MGATGRCGRERETPPNGIWRKFRTRLAEKLTATGYPYRIDKHFAIFRDPLGQDRDNFIWAPGKVVVEPPSRVNANADNVIALALRQRASEVEHELLIESPFHFRRCDY